MKIERTLKTHSIKNLRVKPTFITWLENILNFYTKIPSRLHYNLIIEDGNRLMDTCTIYKGIRIENKFGIGNSRFPRILFLHFCKGAHGWEFNRYSKHMDNVVDIYELSSILKASPHTLKKTWRSLPHFFIGEGTTLRGARFIPDLVIKHLMKEAGNVCVAKSKTKRLDSKVSLSKSTIQERRIQNEIESSGVGSSKAERTRKSARVRAGNDPFNLLSGIDNLS